MKLQLVYVCVGLFVGRFIIDSEKRRANKLQLISLTALSHIISSVVSCLSQAMKYTMHANSLQVGYYLVA